MVVGCTDLNISSPRLTGNGDSLITFKNVSSQDFFDAIKSVNLTTPDYDEFEITLKVKKNASN